MAYPGVSRPSDKGAGGGGGHLHPEKRGGRKSQKNFFWPLGPQFGLIIRGKAPPPGPFPGSPTDNVTVLLFKMLYIVSKNKFVT